MQIEDLTLVLGKLSKVWNILLNTFYSILQVTLELLFNFSCKQNNLYKVAIFQFYKSVFIEMPNKVSKEIAQDVEKQKSKTQAISAKDQGNYVDSSRNIAVSMDSKELSKALKNFERDVSSTHWVLQLIHFWLSIISPKRMNWVEMAA